MDGPAVSADGESSAEPPRETAATQQLPKVVDIAKAGDLILDVTFENSKATVKAARRQQQQQQQAASLKKTTITSNSQQQQQQQQQSPESGGPPKAKLRLGFRVEAGVLRKQSKYFDRLLSDTRFQEAKTIAAALQALALRDVQPADADVRDLPWIQVVDDDEATRYAHRDKVFAELLRILHEKDTIPAATTTTTATTTAPTKAKSKAKAKVKVSTTTTTATKKTPTAKAATTSAPTPAPAPTPTTPGLTMDFVTALAVLADRFDCAEAVSKSLHRLNFKWPVTQRKHPPAGGGGGEEAHKMSRQTENVLRQKILVSWLLNQPPRFHAATRELIMNGSCKWSPFPDPDEEAAATDGEATWWYLQDELEQELQYRRECILNTLASIPRHFLALYASPRAPRQCPLGYDSSAACDSYQLGEMFKFLVNKRLLFPVDFSPGSLDRVADTSRWPVDAVLAALRQVPSYQIDSHHRNCGLRARVLPVLDFVQALLSAGSVPVAHAAWKQNKQAAAWFSADAGGGGGGGTAVGEEEKRRRGKFELGDDDDDDDGPPPKTYASSASAQGTFRFTRALAGDPRLRFENAMGADQFARDVFTAPAWDWTADQEASPITSRPSLKLFH